MNSTRALATHGNLATDFLGDFDQSQTFEGGVTSPEIRGNEIKIALTTPQNIEIANREEYLSEFKSSNQFVCIILGLSILAYIFSSIDLLSFIAFGQSSIHPYSGLFLWVASFFLMIVAVLSLSSSNQKLS